MHKYGILIGRFQPLHLGHQAIISEIIADGLIPIVIIGSTNKSDDKNPYSGDQRIEMFYSILDGHNMHCMLMDDYPTDEEWIYHLHNRLQIFGPPGNYSSDCLLPIIRPDITIYYYRKPHDIKDGIHHLDCLKPHFKMKEAVYPDKLGIKVNATDIRSNLEENKHFLDGRIYRLLKEWEKIKWPIK